MAKSYEFTAKVRLGALCSGYSLSKRSNGSVELTNDEVKQLITLMRKHNSSDMATLNLPEALPEIYKKLADAHYDAAYRATLSDRLDDALYDDECDLEPLMRYCERKLGYDYINNPDFTVGEYGVTSEDDAADVIMQYLQDLMDGKSITFTRNGIYIQTTEECGEVATIALPRGDEGEEQKLDNFRAWLQDYVLTADLSTLHTIFLDYLDYEDCVFDFDEDSYEVQIPEAIVKKATLNK